MRVIVSSKAPLLLLPNYELGAIYRDKWDVAKWQTKPQTGEKIVNLLA